MKTNNPHKKLTLIKKTIAHSKVSIFIPLGGGRSVDKKSFESKKWSGIRLYLKIKKRKKNAEYLEITIDITLNAKVALLFFLIIQMSCC
jgi:hypothetical protein